MILRYKQFLKYLDIKIYLFLKSVNIIMKYPIRTIGANRRTNHIFKWNNFRDGQTVYQVKESMDMTINEL